MLSIWSAPHSPGSILDRFLSPVAWFVIWIVFVNWWADFHSLHTLLPENWLIGNLKYFSLCCWKTPPESTSPTLLFSVPFTHPRNESSAVGNWLTVWGLTQEADGTEKQDGFQLLPFQAWLTRDEPAENLYLTADCQFDEQRVVTTLHWHQPLLPLVSLSGLQPLKREEEGGQEHFCKRSSCFKHPQVTGLLGGALV